MGMAAVESQFHVLAVDDSVIDRKLIERLLKTSACQVTTVDSGSKALEFLGLREHDKNQTNCVSLDNHQESEINLIITDYCMPGMTGYDLLKKIKKVSLSVTRKVASRKSWAQAVETTLARKSRVRVVETTSCRNAGQGEGCLHVTRKSQVQDVEKSSCRNEGQGESASLRNIPVVIMSSENVPSRISRCLEEGAEEFFLKPVRLSDVNKLRPHMMKTKCKSPKQQQQPEIIVAQDNQESIDITYVVPSEENQESDNIVQQQKSQGNSNNNKKRKTIEENLSPDRTRQRLSSLAAI
ncbi:hypothetical protein H5410_054124 [Solanum commersonii]|uniref:Response regulatory domain-containing protein n=1 Tax=Solanum commersonii TaxID=4109 RepID=A0A9J5X5C4_SOLCO|nr:hypothetical protein H5410_054124 [Solanum commersonii]